MAMVKEKNEHNFADYIPNNVKTTMCNVAPRGLKKSATLLSNTTAVNDKFKSVAERYSELFKNKPFLHHYTGQGMDEMEFTEAESNLNDIITEYQ